MKKHGKDKIEVLEEIKKNVIEIVDQFNRKYFSRDDCFYTVRFEGKYCYLDRSDYGRIGPIFRLTYTGAIDKWKYAIFKWSSEQYDPNEFYFPGSNYLDGTIEGAMRAGLEAYPI